MSIQDDETREHLLDICDLLRDALYVDPQDTESIDKVLGNIRALEDRIKPRSLNCLDRDIP